MHNIKDMINHNYCIVTDINTYKNEFDGVYATDLLSTAIKHVKHKEALITIIATHTTISLSIMLDIEVVIISSGLEIDQKVIDKANENKIALIKTNLLTHEVIIDLYQRGFI